MGKILCDKNKCKKCRDIIKSKSVHSYVECSCGAVAVDGAITAPSNGTTERREF
jgi:hypothetical protein